MGAQVSCVGAGLVGFSDAGPVCFRLPGHVRIRACPAARVSSVQSVRATRFEKPRHVVPLRAAIRAACAIFKRGAPQLQSV